MGSDKEVPVRLVHVSTAMAAVSLICATMLYLKVGQLERDLGSPRATPRDVDRLPDMALEGRGRSLAPETRPAGEVGRDAAPAAAHAGDMRDGKPVSLEERIARLEREQKTLRAGHGMPMFSEKFARNIDDLEKQLSLTSAQRTRIEDAVGRARQRIEDVLRIPDETGKSPFERRAEARKKLEETMKNPQAGGVLAFASDLMSHRNRKIPGRNDTYGGEIDRIRKEARQEIKNELDPKQQETFQQTNVDAMLGDAGEQVSFAYAMGDAGGGVDGMVVEMDSNVVTEDIAMPDEGETPPEAGEGGGR
jgi:Spy/CpxP family protein refolding chaperone